MNAVPFELFGPCHGLLRTTGLIRDEGDHLCLEFQTTDRLFGAYKTRVKRVRVPLTDVAAVALETPWLGHWAKLVLRSERLEPFAAIPGASQGRVVLHVARPDRAAARRFYDGLHVATGSGK